MVTQDIGGGFGNKITSHPQLVACCLLARKLGRPIQWTECAHRLPPVDVARQRALVPGRRGRGQGRRHAARLPLQGARRRRRVPALRAARRRDLGAGHAGHVPLAQHPRRLHAGRHEQGARLAEPRLLAHAAPVADRARHRHRRARARLRSDRAAQAQLHPARADAVRDAERRASTTRATTRARSTSRSS